MGGLAYLAYYLHFEHEHEPYVSGFYCDETVYRQQLIETKFTKQFNNKDNELIVVVALWAIPIVIVSTFHPLTCDYLYGNRN